MAMVVPTVLAATPDEYAIMMERARSLNERVHVDICDGKFADATTIGLAQVNVPDDTMLDLHLMVRDPAAQLETALSLHPHLIIFHAESEGDVAGCIRHTQELGIKAGIALLQSTEVATVRSLIVAADHALVFTGRLGHNGGELAIGQLTKASAIRALKPNIEISVDGGVVETNAAQVAGRGVNVLYVGEFLQAAADPKAAYAAITHQAVVPV
jgi:ribulose-phosphate 3-epimerase